VPLYRKAQEFAQQNGGKLISSFFEPELLIKCCRGHEWRTPCKNYTSKWCLQCKRILKEEFKQYNRDEEAKKQKEYERKQEELYQEARR